MKAIILALAIGLSTLGLSGTASANERGHGGRGYNPSHYNHNRGYQGYSQYRGNQYQHNYQPSYRPAYIYPPVYRQSYAPSWGYPGYVQPGLSFGFSFGR